MSAAAISPEAARNARIQLRPRRMLAAALISAVASFAAYVFYRRPRSPMNLLEFVLIMEVTLLMVGGGIYCIQSIHAKKS
jgi:hypothetical protein